LLVNGIDYIALTFSAIQAATGPLTLIWHYML
jgi:hypothetical protein